MKRLDLVITCQFQNKNEPNSDRFIEQLLQNNFYLELDY
jgi:hypothetical protein